MPHDSCGAASESKRLFDAFAAYYRTTDGFSLGILRRLRRDLIRKALIPNKGLVVDLMCGTGNNLPVIRKAGYRDTRYLGVDVSDGMIDQALKEHSHDSEAEFLRSDVFNLRLPRASADHVLCSFGMRCVGRDKYGEFAGMLNTLLAPTGGFSVMDVRVPRSRVLRALVHFYLITVYRAGCFLLMGNDAPVTALLNSLSPPVDVTGLKDCLKENGLDAQVREKWSGAVVFVTGEKRQPPGPCRADDRDVVVVGLKP